MDVKAPHTELLLLVCKCYDAIASSKWVTRWILFLSFFLSSDFLLVSSQSLPSDIFSLCFPFGHCNCNAFEHTPIISNDIFTLTPFQIEMKTWFGFCWRCKWHQAIGFHLIVCCGSNRIWPIYDRKAMNDVSENMNFIFSPVNDLIRIAA